ncbi:MAG: hypothetical protein OXC31_28470 [Spirochaetaceae bacterium]|nr:hypothetical protein [Spirochaetaceae bacterium]
MSDLLPEITSYPGPVPGIERDHLRAGARVPSAPARNRRIGEFLKELDLAEERLTGLPKIFQAMEQNGSRRPGSTSTTDGPISAPPCSKRPGRRMPARISGSS